MFSQTSAKSYMHKVIGTWGEFATPSGRVEYILTKARLGNPGADNERRLTKLLRPVRELLDPKELDFNQLLQRDLEDHRVATQLLPYLLQTKTFGPGFFPPIVAVLLPFAGQTPVNSFPTGVQSAEPIMDEGAPFRETQFGSAFAIRQLCTPDGKPHPSIRIGECLWNEEEAKLVVIDGQHRAMALIAIDRTLTRTWDHAGARYRHFYETHVQDLVEKGKVDLNHIEIPVAVCWFPDLPGPEPNAHKAARKLFVDVNKEARQPSEARLTLLSDTHLLNIFTRALLNRLRQPAPPLPLNAIEYDNPDPDTARPVRWSVVANLMLLKFATQYLVFGPVKYIQRLELRFGGRPNWTEMNARMREELDVTSLYTEIIEDGERSIERANIANNLFPLSEVDKLTERFMEGWGAAILTVLGQLLPYAAHSRALKTLEQEWVTDDAMASLARDALFDGVGMYWTLRDSHEAWSERRRQLEVDKKIVPPKPEIAKAWDILKAKEKDFYLKRTLEYSSRSDAATIEKSKVFFELVNTHACQLGAMLAVATLAEATKARGVAVKTLTEAIVAAWNAGLQGTAGKGDRRFAFSRDVSDSINRIGKLDTPFGVYFRYFWLELLATKEAREVLAGRVQPELLQEKIDAARANYWRYLVDEQLKSLQASAPGARGKKERLEKLREKAMAIESSALRKALDKWFGVEPAAFDEWLERVKGGKVSQPPPDGGDEIADGDLEGAVGDNVDVDELIRDARED